VIGRWGIALALIAFPYARTTGLGREIKDNARTPQAVLATVFALVVLLVAARFYNPWAILAVFFIALITWLAVMRFTLKRIPGLTGDIYGATNLLIETTVLLALVVSQGGV
jgi:adenosylcobinamide-GDP ribazoletransferase